MAKESDDTNPIDHHFRAVKLICMTALAVSVVYTAAYVVLGFSYATWFLGSFCIVYSILLKLTNTKTARVIGIMVMGAGLTQIIGLSLLFIPPKASTHTFILLIPIFSLIGIKNIDKLWWWFYTFISVSIIVYLEWTRDIYVPLFKIEFTEEMLTTNRTVNIFSVITMILLVLRNFHNNLHKAKLDLQESYQRSEDLLLNILPMSIANRLKKQQGTIADDVESASVLFADLVGFTTLASKITATETVTMLNAIFSEFDYAVDEHGLEKIKTIGDAYMVAGGIPTETSDHLQQMVAFAQQMLVLLQAYNEKHGSDLQLRIGIAIGPVTAGVIGARKFSYDIWGDTVNVASRMESSGIPGRIQVTDKVAKAAKSHFQFEERGEIQIKGKGSMKTFLLAAPE
jgi:class 3 adenylate cyclase